MDLGDGHITAMPRTERLRIFLDARYATIVDETEALLKRCFPANRVGRVVRKRTMEVLWVYHGHLACLHQGCIRSDGCAFVNGTGRYEYLSYEFGVKS